MGIAVTCPRCGKAGVAPDGSYGAIVQCTGCGSPVRVPTPPPSVTQALGLDLRPRPAAPPKPPVGPRPRRPPVPVAVAVALVLTPALVLIVVLTRPLGVGINASYSAALPPSQEVLPAPPPAPDPPPSPPSDEIDFAKLSLEHQMAIAERRDWVSSADPTVARMRHLIDDATLFYKEGEADICLLTLRCVKKCEADGLAVLPSELLGGSVQCAKHRRYKDGYLGFVTIYFILRHDSRKPHAQAIEDQAAMSRALYPAPRD